MSELSCSEKDLDEVLQAEQVFFSVSKGVLAGQADLEAAWPGKDVKQILQIILKQGEVQMGQAERKIELETLWKDIAQFVAFRCVNSETQRPLTIGLVERAMKELHFSVNPARSAKQQALELITRLAAFMPIKRALMRLRLNLPAMTARGVREAVVASPGVSKVENEAWATNGSLTLTILIDPGAFRAVDEAVRAGTRGGGSVEVLDLAVHEAGDEILDSSSAPTGGATIVGVNDAQTLSASSGIDGAVAVDNSPAPAGYVATPAPRGGDAGGEAKHEAAPAGYVAQPRARPTASVKPDAQRAAAKAAAVASEDPPLKEFVWDDSVGGGKKRRKGKRGKGAGVAGNSPADAATVFDDLTLGQ